MKFRWVPWYKETILTSQSNFEVLGRLRKAIGDDHWEIFSSDIYTGHVYNNKFKIFFRRWFAFTKESGIRSPLILLGEVEKIESGCSIKINIILNWLLYLIFIPILILPLVFAIFYIEWRGLLISIIFYILLILSWNLHAYNLYRVLKEAIR